MRISVGGTARAARAVSKARADVPSTRRPMRGVMDVFRFIMAEGEIGNLLAWQGLAVRMTVGEGFSARSGEECFSEVRCCRSIYPCIAGRLAGTTARLTPR